MGDNRDKTNYFETSIVELRKKIKRSIKISDADWETIKENISIRSSEKNYVLHEAGNVEEVARFILKGNVKIKHHSETPYIMDFRGKGDFLSDVASLFSNRKSCFTFQTITKCEWLEINVNELKELNENIHYIASNLLIDHLKNGYQQASFFRFNDSFERYKAFCETKPEIARNSKLRDVASYLNITPQSLSRIRKNLYY